MWTRSAAVRGLVGLGRWSYCFSSHGVESVRNWLWVRGSKRGLGEQGGWKQRLSQMMSLRIPDSQIERVTYHCLAELSYIINKLVLAFSDAGISDIWAQISAFPAPSERSSQSSLPKESSFLSSKATIWTPFKCCPTLPSQVLHVSS